MCGHLPFNSWRIRHDKVKIMIQSIGNECGVVVNCEPYGIFSPLIPTAATQQNGPLHNPRDRQGLLPDFLLTFPSKHGPTSATLAELKLLSAGATWYHNREKTVDRRASQLPREYKTKLRRIDQQFLGTDENQKGPLEQKLDTFGDLRCLVVGQLCEGLQDLHKLLQTFASEKAEKLGRASGRPLSVNERGLLLQQPRQRLLVCAIRAQSACVLSRIGHYGPAARSAAQRRETDRHRQEQADRDMRSHWLATVQGRGLQRFGSLHF